ncbi:hypothetical protein CDAR_567581 [Caerostris darwini]|uniref:Uncharacterized protein n=1 Tax=Caerostris darwini TaxID=1538125 RepID=A0AAV4QXP7_9ARAC|nr:hypothetical protein CDAR_567581 [Caerostris darwini]
MCRSKKKTFSCQRVLGNASSTHRHWKGLQLSCAFPEHAHRRLPQPNPLFFPARPKRSHPSAASGYLTEILQRWNFAQGNGDRAQIESITVG